MRFAVESTSEASADERPDNSTVAKRGSPGVIQPTTLGEASTSRRATPSSATPRKGILRNNNHPSASKDSSRAPRATTFSAPDDADQNQSPWWMPSPTSAVTPRSLGQTRVRATTPLFQMVGQNASQSSPSRPTRPGPSSRPSSAPSWMRSHLDNVAADHTPKSSRFYRDGDLSSDDSDDQDGSTEFSSSDESSPPPITSSPEDAFTDSEEEEWPVQPGRIGTGALRTNSRQKDAIRRKRRDLARKIRLASLADEWESWDMAARETAWDRARSTYEIGLRSFSAGAEGGQGGHLASPLAGRKQVGKGFPVSSPSDSQGGLDAELDEVRTLLTSLNVKHDEQQKKEREAFEARNRALWQSIDASILAAEEEAKKAAAAEAEQLAAARRAQEEAEKKAEEERENERRRIESEKKAKEEEEARKKKAEEERKKEEEEARQREEKEKAMGGGGQDIKLAAQKEFDRWTAKITHIKQNVLPMISQNPDLRKQCFAAKRQITPKVGQLTNSKQEIVRITSAIGSVLSAAKAASPTGEIYTWILNHLSKCLIRQAEQEVAAKQDTAYPLARVVVWLLLQGHAELGDVLMARLVKKCCWVLAYWPGKKAGQDDEAYRKTLGYKAPDESSENYTNRMSGIFAFFVAILQTRPTAPPGAASMDVSQVPEFLRSKTLWTWAVRTLSADAPILDHPLLPSLWSTYLEVGGNRALAIYGKQMAKVCRLMLEEGLRGKRAGFVKKGEQEGYVKAAIVRLELLLEGWEKSGKVQEATKGSEMEEP